MLGSNNIALRQHAYSVFTASRRDGAASKVPDSVLRPMARTPERPELSSRAPGGSAARSVQPAQIAEPKASSLPGTPPRLGEPLGHASQPADMAGREPTQEEIRARAFERFQARQGQPGDPVADWLEAEADLRRERGLL
ncbi:MAG: DUF2934 domain-containing protein [Phycisphaerales bacterium]